MSYIIGRKLGAEQNLPYYVVGIGTDFYQNDIINRNDFPHDFLIFFTKGEGKIRIGEREEKLKEGSMVYFPRYLAHSYFSTAGEWRSWWICFDGSGADSLMDILGIEPGRIYDLSDTRHLQRKMKKMYRELSDDRQNGGFMASADLYDYLIICRNTINNLPYRSPKANSGLLNAVDYMESHYERKISMEDLCRYSDLSEAHLCRLFKKEFSMRPMEYLNRMRISKAKELLSRKHMSVEKSAYACGFESTSYFAKLFRRYEGCSPSEYRDTLTLK